MSGSDLTTWWEHSLNNVHALVCFKEMKKLCAHRTTDTQNIWLRRAPIRNQIHLDIIKTTKKWNIDSIFETRQSWWELNEWLTSNEIKCSPNQDFSLFSDLTVKEQHTDKSWSDLSWNFVKNNRTRHIFLFGVQRKKGSTDKSWSSCGGTFQKTTLLTV